MNKDVIYVEPADDITDIIGHIRQSREKVVALVPPKKIGVLRSAVNTKLIAKTAREKNKVVVMVTRDPSLVKLAAAAAIPVAATLQSRPKLPSEILPQEESAGEEIIDENTLPEEEAPLNGVAGEERSGQNLKPEKNRKRNTQEISSDDLEKPAKKADKPKNKALAGIEKYRKFIIPGVAIFVVLVVFLVWALVFAPAVIITVAIRTTAANFSENISLTTKDSIADPENGIFLLESQSLTSESKVEFEATGEEDKGEKASGSLVVSAVLKQGVSITITENTTTFTYSDYTFVATETKILDYDSDSSCVENDPHDDPCKISTEVTVQATAAGEKYNLDAKSTGWTSNIDISNIDKYYFTISNKKAFTGGTSKIVKVVQQSDIDTATANLDTAIEDKKSELADMFDDDTIVIESSYATVTADPTSSVAVGNEANGKVTLSAKTTYTLYGVDKTAVENYISAQTATKLASDQKIYEISDIFFESFREADTANAYGAKLKASAKSGPTVTEEDILEKAKGKKIGDVQSLLRSITGVSSVTIDQSFFWVSSVPDDANKITIELEVEE